MEPSGAYTSSLAAVPQTCGWAAAGLTQLDSATAATHASSWIDQVTGGALVFWKRSINLLHRSSKLRARASICRDRCAISYFAAREGALPGELTWVRSRSRDSNRPAAPDDRLTSSR